MAAISSATTLKQPFHLNPTTKPTSLSSSNSVFFTNKKLTNRAGLFLNRPNKVQNRGLSCTCLFGLGVPELAVIAGVAALVFGPKKLPEVGRSFGKTIKSFQQAAKEFESELKKDNESSDELSGEKVTPVNEDEKPEQVKVPSTKESS